MKVDGIFLKMKKFSIWRRGRSDFSCVLVFKDFLCYNEVFRSFFWIFLGVRRYNMV